MSTKQNSFLLIRIGSNWKIKCPCFVTWFLFKMSSESLRKAGLYFDDLNKIRVLDPEASQNTNLLKEECKEYVNSEFAFLI